MRHRRELVAVAVAALAAILPASATGTFPGATGLLAFQSDRDGDFGIWTSNGDGSNPQPLYDPTGTHEFNPAWSPSGTHLVAQTGPLDRSTFDLVIVDALTGDATPLLDGPTNDSAAQFCDPESIVFTRQTDPVNADIWSVRTNGGGVTQLTTAPGRDSFPTCSPDSEHIAFISTRGGPPAIWEMERNGSDPRLLVPGPSLDPDYAPDGTAIAYAAPDPADGNLEIFTRELATGTTTQRTFTAPPTQNRLPHFAPAFGTGVTAPRGSLALLAAPSSHWLYFTRVDPNLAFPEQNLVIADGVTGTPTAFCGNPVPGQPGVPPNPPPGDPGGPKNNSAIAPQPTPGCRLSADGTLTVEGTEGPDNILVRELADRSLRVEVNGTETSYPAGAVKGIRILGKGGDDRISEGLAGVSVPLTADGGAGIDIVFGDVTIEGTPNADRVVIKTVEDDDAEDYGTTITVNGQATALGVPVHVKLEGFDAKDTVVSDDVTNVDINGWLRIRGVRFMSIPNPIIRATGTPANDQITVKLEQNAQQGGRLRFTRNGQEAPVITGIFGLVRIEVAGRGGRDRVTSNVPVNPVGQRVKLRALGGPLIAVRVDGGPGADRITCRGAGQTCTVLAGAGNDTVDVRDGTRSVVDGGAGFDRVSADNADQVRRAEAVTRS